jgi:hypothetical protein
MMRSFGSLDHRAEFDDREGLAMPAHPLLQKEDGAA